MFICEDCHNNRQNRQALESQPLQYTEHHYKTYSRGGNCCDCGSRAPGEYYEYMSAFELVQEVTEYKRKLAIATPPDSFPVSIYHSASDMLERSKIFPSILNDTEAMYNVLQYAAEIEYTLDEVQP